MISLLSDLAEHNLFEGLVGVVCILLLGGCWDSYDLWRMDVWGKPTKVLPLVKKFLSGPTSWVWEADLVLPETRMPVEFCSVGAVEAQPFSCSCGIERPCHSLDCSGHEKYCHHPPFLSL